MSDTAFPLFDPHVHNGDVALLDRRVVIYASLSIITSDSVEANLKHGFGWEKRNTSLTFNSAPIWGFFVYFFF